MSAGNDSLPLPRGTVTIFRSPFRAVATAVHCRWHRRLSTWPPPFIAVATTVRHCGHRRSSLWPPPFVDVAADTGSLSRHRGPAI